VHYGGKHTAWPPAQLHPLQHLLPTPVPITPVVTMHLCDVSLTNIIPKYTEQGFPVNLYMRLAKQRGT
jgi:hypothetical protein